MKNVNESKPSSPSQGNIFTDHGHSQFPSSGAREHGFLPAYRDNATGKVYLSRDQNGKPAKIHLLDGLPRELIIQAPDTKQVLAIKDSVVAGFVKDAQFYTRSQAALAVQRTKDTDD